jgi:3-isopropylmalate/(R)-2-methylmalate dehydratase small subunit
VVVSSALHEALLAAPFSFVTIDLESMTVALEDGKREAFGLDPFARHCLMNGLDELGFLVEQLPVVAAWEAACER